jgi:long-chain acyl-CoA synthetase
MLVAIVVPNPDTLKIWASTNGKSSMTLEELCSDAALNEHILKDIQSQGKARGLNSFEIPKGIFLEATAWTPDDVLTPTFKLKRKDAKTRYQAKIDSMYYKLEHVAGLHVNQG